MMRWFWAAVLAAGSLSGLSHAQQTLPPVDAASAPLKDAPSLKIVVLKKDTPVELMAYSEVSTADSAPGKRFKLLLNQPIVLGGSVIAAKGAIAFGEVTSAEESGSLGKSGRMTAKILFLRLGEIDVPLDGQASAKGTGAGSAGVAILFTGWAGLFHRGNNAKIKAGELLTAFVAEDVALDVSATPIRRAPAPTAALQ